MLEKITSDNIIDTNNTESLEKYKNNLELLIKETKEKGYIDKFALIRNDDFFPYNSEWIVNSENTNGEEYWFVIQRTNLLKQRRKVYLVLYLEKTKNQLI